MRTPSLALFPVLLAPLLLPAAPAPTPRGPVADAVVAVNPGDAKKAGERLKAKALLAAVVQAEAVRKLPALSGQSDPAAWVARRLQVSDVPGGRGLRVALTDCPPKEALTILAGVVEAHVRVSYTPSAQARQQMEYVQRIRQLYEERKLRNLEMPATIVRRIAEYEQQIALDRARMVLQAPRLVAEAKADR